MFKVFKVVLFIAGVGLVISCGNSVKDQKAELNDKKSSARKIKN